jgi:hypothetical protein
MKGAKLVSESLILYQIRTLIFKLVFNAILDAINAIKILLDAKHV